MGPQNPPISKADALAEAYKRGLLPPDRKAAYEEALKRGLVQPAAAAPKPAPMSQPDATPWGDGQAFDDMYARKPQTDPMLSPLRPDARTLTSGAPTQMKPPPAPRGPVMSPAQRMATQPERDAAVAKRTEQANRWKTDSPFGTPVDEMGMPIAVTDAQRDGGMYGVRDDVGKGIVASPIHAERAVVGATESILNLPADVYNEIQRANARHVLTPQEEMRNVNRMPQLMGQVGVQKAPPVQVPRFDFSAAKIPVPQELESATGYLGEGLAQFLISRKLVGTAAPGGGMAANLGKDAGAVFVGIDGSSGRLADIIPADAIPEGPLRDYFNYLKTQPDDSPLLGRFKNFLEDMTVSGPMIVPQAVVAPTARAVGNAINPALTPTNAGGVAARAGVPQTPSVAPAVAAAQPQQPVAPPVTQTAPQAPTQPQTVTAPPVPPIPPNTPAVTAGAPQPGPAGQVPPAGQLTPVSNLGPAEQAFNNLPMKTRESMLNAFNSAGVTPDRAKAMIGELNNLPDGQNTMYALEVMRRNGLSDADIDGVLIAMGREFATESPRPAGRVFNREQDSARQIMNDQVRTQINSEGRSITDVAERNFGEGVVPAGEALDLELDQLSNAYETILSTKRSPTGRLRSPAKKDAVYRAREELTNALVSPEVMQTIPQDVKLQIMMQASDDMRRLKFTPDELGVILQGDGAVLAPLFNGYGALSWSPDLWAHLARQYPTQAAHSLQSALRKAADEAFRRGDATAGRYYKRLRGESGKGGLLDTLERAVPKYKETRVQFGDASSAKEALDILERFKAAAASEGDVAKIIKDLEGLPQRHREMAEQQITSIIRQELARKVESPRLAELGQTVAQTPNLTSLSRQDFLKALEDVFGPRGKELADAIRAARARTDTLTSISPKYNSRTELNRQDVQNAPALYEAPGSLEGGIIDAGVKRLGTVAGGASLIPGGQGAALALGAATAVQAAMNAARRGKRLSNAERNALVDFLFKSRTADDAAPPVATRGPSMGDYAQAIGRDAVIGAGVGAVADGDPLNNDPMALIGGAVGGAAGYGRARIRNARSLIKPPPAPRGAGRRNPPPAGPSVGGPNAPRPLPGQTSNSAPAVTGALVGGAAGYAAAPEDQKGLGLVAGIAGGGVLGAGAGRLARGVQPPKPRVSPPPVGGRAPPVRMGFGGSGQPSGTRSLLQTLARPNEPQRVADLLAGTPVSVTREEAKEMLDLIRMHLRPEDPYEYGKGFGFTLDELKADPSIAEDFLGYDPQKMAKFQAVLGTVSPPRVRNGLRGNAEAIGAGTGAVLAPDADRDGEISFGERAGAAITGGVLGNIARRASGTGAPKVKPPMRGADQAGYVKGGIRYGSDPTRTENVFRDVGGKPFNNDPAATKKLNRLFNNGNYIDAKLPTHRLYATQETVNAGFAENTANRYVEGAGGVEAPAVVKYKGNYYVTDGHHRVTKAVMDGRSNVRVRLYDIDGDTSLDTPLLDFNPERHAKDRAEIRMLLDELFADAEPVSAPKPPASQGFGSGKAESRPKPPPKGQKAPPKGPSFPPRLAADLNKSKVSPATRATLDQNAALPPGERKSVMEATGWSDEILRIAAPYIRPGSRMESEIGNRIARLVQEANANPVEYALRQTMAKGALEEAQKRFKQASGARSRAANNLENLRSRNMLNPNQPATQQQLTVHKQRRDDAEQFLSEAARLRDEAKVMLDRADVELMSLTQVRDFANKEIQRITDALGGQRPKASATAMLPAYNPLGPPRVGGAASLLPPKPPGGRPSKRAADELAHLLFEQDMAEKFAKIQSGEITPTQRNTFQQVMSWYARHPSLAAVSAVAAGGSVVGYAALATDQGERAVQARENARKRSGQPEPELPGPPAWDWEKLSRNPRFAGDTQAALQALGYKIGKIDNNIRRADGKRTESEKALYHFLWTMDNTRDPEAPPTEAEWDALKEAALQARRRR